MGARPFFIANNVRASRTPSITSAVERCVPDSQNGERPAKCSSSAGPKRYLDRALPRAVRSTRGLVPAPYPTETNSLKYEYGISVSLLERLAQEQVVVGHRRDGHRSAPMHEMPRRLPRSAPVSCPAAIASSIRRRMNASRTRFSARQRGRRLIPKSRTALPNSNRGARGSCRVPRCCAREMPFPVVRRQSCSPARFREPFVDRPPRLRLNRRRTWARHLPRVRSSTARTGSSGSSVSVSWRPARAFCSQFRTRRPATPGSFLREGR